MQTCSNTQFENRACTLVINEVYAAYKLTPYSQTNK